MTLINLTPHTINLDTGVNSREYKPSGLIARIDMDQLKIGEIDGFPIYESRAVGNNLPPVVADTYYIVSAMVLDVAKSFGRTDCLAPNSTLAVRNEKGHIISVPGFIS